MSCISSQMFRTIFPIFLLCFTNFIVGAPVSHSKLSCALKDHELNWIVNLRDVSLPHIKTDDVTKVFNGKDLNGFFSFRNVSITGLPQVVSHTKIIFGPKNIHVRIPLENLVLSGLYEISHGQISFGLGNFYLWNGSINGKGQFTVKIVNASLLLQVGLQVQPKTELVSVLVSKIELVASAGDVCDKVQVQMANLTVNGAPFDEKKYCHLAQKNKFFYPLYITHHLNSFVEGCTLSDLRRILNRHNL